MINIAVSAQRVFTVPADLARTTAHFRDFGHTLDYLAPHLRLVATYARDQYRMLYSVTEAGVYRVAFYCDIQVRYDESSQILQRDAAGGRAAGCAQGDAEFAHRAGLPIAAVRPFSPPARTRASRTTSRSRLPCPSALSGG